MPPFEITTIRGKMFYINTDCDLPANIHSLLEIELDCEDALFTDQEWNAIVKNLKENL